MYLPSYPQVAKDFGVPDAVIALTLSSYFIGLALGQVFYGPLLDRFGRKKPLYFGLSLFIVASIACVFAPAIEPFIALRFIQALGGCVAGVSSLAVIHDLFPPEERAKILSRLFLFIAVSPLLAPTIGGLIAAAWGWKAGFWLLAAVVAGILALIYFLLPESHQPDAGISLKPGPILAEYFKILCHPRFATYAVWGAFSFAGLFTYVAGAPIVFMEGFGVDAKTFSAIFAGLATGLIGCSQFNVWLLGKWSSEQVFFRLLIAQVTTAVVFTIGSFYGWYGLPATLVLFFVFLSCTGLTYPNAAALALSPFSRNAGSASAMLGFLQLGVGALISTGIGVFAAHDSFPIIAILGVTSSIGLVTLLLGRKGAEAVGEEAPAPTT